jgi:type IV pilus assembly protein PilQ
MRNRLTALPPKMTPRNTAIVAAEILLCLLTACIGSREPQLHTGLRQTPDAAANRDSGRLLTEAAQACDRAERLMTQGQLEQAQGVLAPFFRYPPVPERVATLNAQIAAALTRRRMEEANQRLLARSTKTQVAKAKRELERGHAEKARKILDSIPAGATMDEEISELRADLEQHDSRRAIGLDQQKTAHRAIIEVEEGLLLPETYGRTVQIDPDTTPHTAPPGPVEALLAKPVSLVVEDAGVAELVRALSDVEGLNLIVDQELAGARHITVNVHDVPLEELLAYVSRNMGVAFHVGRNAVWVTEADEIAAPGPALETRIYELHTGFIPKGGGGAGLKQSAQNSFQEPDTEAQDDTELEDALQTFLGPEGETTDGRTYRIFRDRNVLVARNTRENLALLEELLDTLDRPPRQVLIEARFITIRDEDLYKLGLNLQGVIVPREGTTVGFSDLRDRAQEDIVLDKGQTIVPREQTLSPSLDKKRLEASGSFPGTMTVSGILGNTTFQAVLDALKEVTAAKTLSAPRVTVTNNRPAYIFRGTKRFYFEEYELEQVDFGDLGTRSLRVPTGTPKELPLGLFLSVRPNIGNDRQTLILALKPEITSFVDWEQFDNEGFVKLPIVNSESLETTVVIRTGETVVLGGMMTKSEKEQVRKVPYLGNIPWLGAIFRQEERENSPEHLLIFVTAQIVESDGTYLAASQDNGSNENSDKSAPQAVNK